MRKIFRTNLQLGLFIAGLIITIVTAFLGYSNSDIEEKWVNMEYKDYSAHQELYSVAEVPIKEFRTLSGSNYSSLTYVDFYRVCVVDVTFAGGQTGHFYVSRSKDDKEGDVIEVAYEKYWDTDYSKVMNGSDIEEGDIIMAARTSKVTDGMYPRLFAVIAIVSAVFTGVVFFICYRQKDSYGS